MQKWEYFQVALESVWNRGLLGTGSSANIYVGTQKADKNAALPDILNKLGQEGWELAGSLTIPAGSSSAGAMLIFKRPLP